MFPGQGAQYVGMGRDFHDRFDAARRVFHEADEILGMPISSLCLEGPEEALIPTEIQQPAILTVSVAMLAVLREMGVEPVRVAGLSLGEYAALVAAGVLSFEEALPLVKDRGRYMQEAVPPGVGAMAAVMGLDREEVAAACRETAAALDTVVQPANYNSPGQIVIAGTAQGVEEAAELCRVRGARRVVMLPVSAPFHSPLMEPAARRLAQRLESVTFHDARVPVVANVDARERTAAHEFVPALIDQVAMPVLWEDCMRTMLAAGCRVFVEVGPGKTLSGFMRRLDSSVNCLSTQDPDSLEGLLATVGEVG